MPDIGSEGLAIVQYKLVLKRGESLDFDAKRVAMMDAQVKDSVYGEGTGLHTFRTLDPTFLDDLKQVMSDANPRLEFRLGYGDPSKMYWLPWQQHIIVKYLSKFIGIGNSAGHLIVLGSANVLTQMARSNRVEARKGTIAEIVIGLAKSNGLDHVVEPTDGKFLLYQSFEDDTRFINERLLARAINRKGRGGYYFFIRDNVLHFHTPDYQASVLQMAYYDSFGRELAVSDLSQDSKLWDNGLAGSRTLAYDPYTGRTGEVKSQPDKALRLADSIYDFGNVYSGERNVMYHLSQNSRVEISAIAQYNYQRARQQTFNCTVSLNKTISIRHGDLLNLSITQQRSQASDHSGYYYVTAAGHVIKRQAVTSVYTLERGEVRGQDQSLSAQDVNRQLLPLSKAPGEDPNVAEIQSSEVTKGAGKQSSDRLFTVVTDANTGKTV